MPTDIVMPNLGFDTQEARIVEWLKQPGDPVRKGDVVAIVESDKANVELESLSDGTLLDQLFPADTVVRVGAVIARVGSKSELATQPAAASTLEMNASPLARRIAEENNLDLSKVVGSGAGGKITRQDVEALLTPAAPQLAPLLALPKVRKAARDAGIDLKLLTPSGAMGQITLDDLSQYRQRLAKAPTVEIPTAVPASGLADGVQEVTLSKMRQTIGQRLSKSMQEAPHFYVTGEFDLEAALRRLNALAESRPRLNDLIQYLTVQTLLRVPQLNATFETGKLYRHSAIHLAVAVGLDEGLITPVIPNAERYSLQGMAQESRALIERARSKRLRPEDLGQGTFTISNLGVIKQVDQFTAVINPPQVAILAVGTAKQRPVVVDGGLHIRHTVHLTLSGDHRAVDGMVLGQFMAAFQAELDAFSQ
jgi:pyruvate dehydrogenase E2 component (dihydrolipoamide acetyltransferase)